MQLLIAFHQQQQQKFLSIPRKETHVEVEQMEKKKSRSPNIDDKAFDTATPEKVEDEERKKKTHREARRVGLSPFKKRLGAHAPRVSCIKYIYQRIYPLRV